MIQVAPGAPMTSMGSPSFDTIVGVNNRLEGNAPGTIAAVTEGV